MPYKITPDDPQQVVMPECPPLSILKGQKAMVTGGNSGIGKACAIALGEAGADVLVNYIADEPAADEVVATIKSFGSRAVKYEADVSAEDQVVKMFDVIRDEFGTVDILVNNAGLQRDNPIENMSLAEWRKVIDVNLTGQFLCAREAVREFKRRGINSNVSCSAGKIICISSVHEIIPWAGHANYASSKGGIRLMMKSIAQEVAPYRIRVNSIAPGAIKTPINKKAWETEEAQQKLLSLIPYNRIGAPEDIARTAVWLASDYADYITGATIIVDGGMTLYPGFATGG
jgi:glucose 1-dehydrogenase